MYSAYNKYISCIFLPLPNLLFLNMINDKKLGDQLTNIVKYVCELAERRGIKEKQLWLDSIPALIFTNELKKKYNIIYDEKSINPIIGEYD